MSNPELTSAPHGGRRADAILITGASGEVGHGLIRGLYDQGCRSIVAIDLRELEPEIRGMCMQTVAGDICDPMLLGRLLAMFEVREIYHLAALLSTRSEFTPETAHDVNVGGTLGLLRLAAEQARSHGQPVKFVFPSSIAAYGMPDLATKAKNPRVRWDQFVMPTTMYGCNKLACEHLGRYYMHHYRQLAKDRIPHLVDFRCLRYPGLISADTVPSGGTSDYGPEMLHAAARGDRYACFVREDTRIPFLTMPDAIDATLALANADRKALRCPIYNLTAWSPTAGEIAALVRRYFPMADIAFEPDLQRQAIVDSWPADIDDAPARADFGFRPKHDLERAFAEYLVPRIKARYAR
jgi:nucleoside-diphosphate-sugar epimerase